MTLDNGRKLLAIPGPSVVPDRVLNAMHQPSPNIYYGPLKEMIEGMIPDLKQLAGTTGDVVFYITNGHGTWEAALSNTVAAGEKVLVLGTGPFALGWGAVAQTLGIEIEVIDFGKQSSVDIAQVETRLLADKNNDIKAILVVQTDTSTSVRNDISALGQAIRATGHPALYMVDCMASLGTEPHFMDEWLVDVMVSGCQKGLMVPAGMGFVFLNNRAHAARREMDRVSYYWDWAPRVAPEMLYQRFAGTPPTHHLMGLREALDMILIEEGLENVWTRHRVFAQAIWAAVDSWGSAGRMWLNIKEPDKRSFAVTSITTSHFDGGKIRDWCENVAGVTLGIGLGMADAKSPEFENYFRIGHMGHMNVPMILGTLGTIDAALKALDIPHGAGALEAANHVIATASR
ncbi:septum site-determining protein [Amylibacter marinus]|uniref:Septum site-determining protein n=1 Tax=Amylibacter marinus TaxID=1475483 RepID=A0ABQ5VRI2_9RHOB|nr:aminotransferase class V-fold PLP-dependent enzyme [Amylibacter marinus]GLQ33881.1 septum site-determining protein [Amylibacter marinus]